MVTDWIVTQVSRLAPSPFSPEAEELIRAYGPENPEAERQFRELALVTGYALLVVPAIGLWGLVAWIVSSAAHEIFDIALRIGWALIVVLLVGLALHLIRYYDALVGRRRGRKRRRPIRWPRASTDLDVLVQIVAGIAAAMAGAPG